MGKKKSASASKRQGRKGSASRASKSRSRSSKRGSKRSSASSRLSLTPERKKDLLGLLLVGLSVFTFISWLTSEEGLLTGAWLELLRGAFGWGVVVIPLLLLGSGLWLLLRPMRDRLPSFEPEQVVGVLLLYLALLTLFHGLLVPESFQEGLAQARAGRGGGVLGAALLALLVGALGGGGTVVALVGWMLLAVAFTVGLSVPELFSLAAQGFTALKEFVSRPAAAGSDSTSSSEVVAASPSIEGPRQPGEGVSQPGHEPTPIAAETSPADLPTQWRLPNQEQILDPGAESKADETFDRERGRLIQETLQSFGAPVRIVEINRGPTITQFGVEPDFIEGRRGRRTKVKVSKISALADDLALALAAPSIRIEAPVPGKGYVGIEVPNTHTSLVALRDIMESVSFQRIPSSLRLGLGKDVSGRPVTTDLAAMPHLLIAGTTGSGKSVCVNAVIASLLLQNTPDQLKFVMVDPKRVELTNFNGIPHLLAPVVVELERVVPALQWVLREMDERYREFSRLGVRNIADYNRRMVENHQSVLPYLVVVIDELADLMIMAPDETERVITRLAQLARATGIHLVIATQRPSVDIVTGLIKANFPARIAFAVASSVDSRVILDQPGAERLLGRGDMLFQAPDAALPVRMQGAFVSEPELRRLIRYWKDAARSGEARAAPEAEPEEPIPPGATLEQAPLWEELEEQEDRDPIYDEAVQVVRNMRRASISLLQRRLRIGYTRAARLVDAMEAEGIIGPAQSGSQPREVLDYGEVFEEQDPG